MVKPEETTVLVVDDEEDVRYFLTTALEEAGFKVETAGDGQEALEKMKANPPDVISLDLIMPKKAGASLFRSIRSDKRLKNIPVVLVTSHARDDLGRQDFDDIMSGAVVERPEEFLEKPVTASAYVESIKRAADSECVRTFVTPSRKERASKSSREELKRLIKDAPPEKIQAMLRILKEQD